MRPASGRWWKTWRSAPGRCPAHVPVFPWGDLSARCTNGNGVLDTEDLNGDTGLDLTGANENVFRYVVDLAAGTDFVRDGVTTTDPQTGRTATWKLYRIPIRQPTATLEHADAPPGAASPRHRRGPARRRDARRRRAVRHGAAPVRRLALGAPVGDSHCRAQRRRRPAARPGEHLGHLYREPARPGIRVATGRVRRDLRGRGQPQTGAPRSTRSRSGSSAGGPPPRRAGRSVPPVPGGGAEPSHLPHAARVDARARPGMGRGGPAGVPQGRQ